MKVDLKKSLDSYRAKRGDFRFLEVPPQRYLMVDGHGAPGSTEYVDAVGAVYPVAYTLKFASSRELGRDYVVPPLEALWWASDMDLFTTRRDKAQWDWTAMILVPEWIPAGFVDDAVATVAAGAKGRPASLDRLRLETLEEGLCVQTLHVGSYDDEAAVLAELHDDVIPDAGLRMTGKHHEIYLNDARRVEASRLRTILRQPVTGA